MSKIQIKRYAYKVPILFEGDRGSGKTFDVREFARETKARYMEIAGHESVEAIDFLGHPMPSEHGMVWKDGKLSQAFRSAREGHDTVLLIDEMLRIPQRHLSVLLSALSADSEGNYRLQTGRMVGVADGVGIEEEIKIPSNKIAIFATTNVGPEFAIDDLDPAIAERFIIARKDTEKAQLTKILQGMAKSRGFGALVGTRLVEFFVKTSRMVETGTLNRHATTRTLARALQHADDEADVKQVLRDQILLWVDRDSSGRPVAEQVKQVARAIDELFPDEPKPVAAPAKAPKAAAPAVASTPLIAKAAAGVASGKLTAGLVVRMLMDEGLIAGGGNVVHALREIELLTGVPMKAPTPAAAVAAAVPGEDELACSLHCTEDGSDKVYNLSLERHPEPGKWRLLAHYGRRGATRLTPAIKADGCSYAHGKAEFESVRSKQMRRGYGEIASTRSKIGI